MAKKRLLVMRSAVPGALIIILAIMGCSFPESSVSDAVGLARDNTANNGA